MGENAPPLTAAERALLLDDEAMEDDAEEEKKPAASAPTQVKQVAAPYPAPTSYDSHLQDWYPLYSISMWTGGEMDKYVTIALLLPSGITKREDSQVRVSDNLVEMVVRVKWPSIMSNVALLHAFYGMGDKGLALPAYHPKIVGFNNFFLNLRDRESDPLYSEATIPLPMKVQKTPVEFRRIGDSSGARVLYVTLRAVEMAAYKGIDDSDFVIINDKNDVTP